MRVSSTASLLSTVTPESRRACFTLSAPAVPRAHSWLPVTKYVGAMAVSAAPTLPA